MKLLIVDDEELTRTGVINSIDWKSLGIDEIFQADDGVNGLQSARQHRPEIILCDVRMPRMDGITMLNQVREILPDTAVIFMSGYSDKEYLKAAIKLKAVTYIEKPILSPELTEAIADAAALVHDRKRSLRAEKLHSLESSSRLVQILTTPGTIREEELLRISNELSIPISDRSHILFSIIHTEPQAEHGEDFLDTVSKKIAPLLQKNHLFCQTAPHRADYFIYCFVSERSPSPDAMDEILQTIRDYYLDFGKIQMSVSSSVVGFSSSYSAYEEAVILLSHAYFYDVGTIMKSTCLQQSGGKLLNPDFSDSDFEYTLQNGDEEGSLRYLQELHRNFSQNMSFLPNQVRDFYYRLNFVLDNVRISFSMVTEESGSILTQMEQCFTYEELHSLLADRVAKYFSDRQEMNQENSTIRLIKDYIGAHFMEDTLSVKEISDHVFLSTSYVCTFFKSETGQTLNQFLTEYRMEQAKRLLRDPRYKITDISSRVGYTDGNYFGKSFKKYAGMSPSEFRERAL